MPVSEKIVNHAIEHVPEHGSGSGNVMHHILDHSLFSFHIWGVEIDFTRHMLMILIAAILLFFLLKRSFRPGYGIPHGLANFFEAVIVFIRDDIIIPNMGKEGLHYAPYLFTAFFFILTCNLMGLVPGATTATGNISVTAALAVLTFFMIQFAGIRQHGVIKYFKGIIPPKLPIFVLPIIIPVEIVGMFTKHVALAIRLFANMTAGHVVIIVLLGLIGTKLSIMTFLIAPFPILAVLFASLLEILIALIQAYIFTILSAVFIGASIHQDH